MCWVYQKVRQGSGDYLYVVGYHVMEVSPRTGDPVTRFVGMEDCSSAGDAQRLVNFLNGGAAEI